MGWLDEILERLEKYSKGINQQEDARTVPDLEVSTHSLGNDVFHRAVEFVLSEEGGYVNDEYDPGGETKYGISKRAHPTVDIANLTRDQAKQIYYEQYWVPIRSIAEHNPNLAIAVFDTAVNMGVRPAIRLLQVALGVTADGVIGPQTRAKIESKSGTVIVNFLYERLAKYQTLATWSRYRKGWTMRVLRLAMEVA